MMLPVGLSRVAAVSMTVSLLATGCMHNVARDMDYVTSQPRHDVVIVANGDTLRFDTLYVKDDSLGGHVYDNGGITKIHIDSIESMYTSEVSWLRVMWVGVASLLLFGLIAFRGPDT